ncbi:zinc-ribbon domain-containing protein [Iocasia frigidifontis]|uniref:Zinc-ribbon domain-containing protein n=1 Tax=Iocasia fonsfrigidae TaxID=2682810 RepID=A0A8A7KJ64_9FIRM|nr:zinc ribbon domain-containing protein [Iocasia fonsfrigidae]QTL99878.1 zinc-ribbon domain-containing protein [Iocasia fonsfrigidae]
MIIIYCPECGNEVNENDKFCSKCGKPIIAKDKLNEKTTNDENKSITIKFRYSSSRNYKRAIDIASNFDSYSTEGKDKDIEHSVTIPLTEINYIFNLMDLISNWKTAEFYLDGKAVSKSDIYRPLNCYKEKVESYDQQRYCFGEEDYNMNFWGCKKLNMPFNRYSAQSGWLSYGQFNDSNEWVFNKDKIYHELMKNIKEYEICPALNVENVKEKFKKFPQKINPTKNENWGYITNYKEVNGQFREVATGIYPKLENDNFIFMDNVEINNNYSNINEEIYADNITKEKTAKSNKEGNMSKTTWEPCPKCQSNNVKEVPNHHIIIGFWIFSILFLLIYRPIGYVFSFISLVTTISTPFIKSITLKCNDCNKVWQYKKAEDIKKEKTTQVEKTNDEEYLIGAKKGGHLKKTLIVLLTLMLPPVGIFFIFKSNKFKNTGKIIASIWLGVFLLMWFVDTDDKNTSEVANQQIQQEVVEDNTDNPLYTNKGLVEIDNIVDQNKESSALYKLIHGVEDFRDPFVEKWNYTLENIQKDTEGIDSNRIDEKWWSWLKLEKTEIEKLRASGWKNSGGGVYRVVFGNSIKVDMKIYNPPMDELGNNNPDLNKFRLSIGLTEDFSEIDSTNKFLSRRRQAVQAMDVALRSILGKGNYNREDLYKFVSDFKEDGWSIGRSELNFQRENWGYVAEKNYDNYSISLEVDKTGEYESEFYLFMDFELN